MCFFVKNMNKSPDERYGFALQKIRFCLVKDKVSSCKRYGFARWKVRFRRPGNKFWTSKKTKNRVILHWFFYLPIYQMVTERQPTLEPTLKPTLNPHWNPHWKIPLWGSRRLTLVSQNPGDDDTNETNYMYGLMTISEIPLQRYNKKTPFPNFREYLPHILRQSDVTLESRGTVEHQNSKQRFPVEGVTRTVVVNYVPHERIFVNAAFSVDKT